MATVRKGKRNRKFLGSKNHGKGNAKNRRGKGGKGGWGRAGTGKHRWTYITAYEPEFAKHGGHMGFHNPNGTTVRTLNVFEIENMAKSGKLPSKEGKMTLEFGGKILGSGQITHAVLVRAMAASEGAIEKITAAGGKFEQMGEGAKKE